jgi:hypothetical protein
VSVDALPAVVLDAWRSVLRDPSLGPDDDFFLSGGHSLLAVQLAERVSEAWGAEVPAGLIFLHPTPAEFAAAASALLDDGDRAG